MGSTEPWITPAAVLLGFFHQGIKAEEALQTFLDFFSPS